VSSPASKQTSKPVNKTIQFGVIGAGSWGTALATLLAHNGFKTKLWGNEADVIKQIQTEQCNQKYLPNIRLADNLNAVDNIIQLKDCDEILLVVPSHAFASVLNQVKTELPKCKRIAYATKGFAEETKLLHTIVKQVFGESVDYAVLSGPTFALEVAKGLPTAVTVASNSIEYANFLAQSLHNEFFRAYTSEDVIGVEIGGAVKNVLAIGAGIADGMGFGANTRAALITRGLTEIMRLGAALGADHETFMGLAGMGDLVLTCTDNLSRNRRFGLALAKGLSPEQAKQEIGQVVEGIKTAKSVYQLSKQLNVSAPITEQVYAVLYENADPKTAVLNLFLRELKPEIDPSKLQS